MLSNVDFPSNAILSCFVFFLFIDLYFSIAQIFNPIEEIVIPIGIPSKEAKAEIEIHPVIVEAIIIHFALFFQENIFLFHIYFLM